MATSNALILRIEADTLKFHAQMRAMQRETATALARVQGAHNAAARGSAQAWQRAGIGQALQNAIGQGGVGRSLTLVQAQIATIASSLVAAFGVEKIAAMTDEWTRFTNALKAAGLEGQKLADVQDALYASAQRNGTEMTPLAKLYGTVSMSAKELGATQQDLIAITDAVAASVRVSGSTMTEASGAIMQLGQALGGETIMAEEWNSMLENLKPLLQEVANQSTHYAGSLSKLTKDAKDGKIASDDFAKAIVSAKEALALKADQTDLTMGAAWQTVTNAVTKYIGTANESLGVTDKIVSAMQSLSENLDDVVVALQYFGIVMGGVVLGRMAQFITTTIQSTIASNAQAASLGMVGRAAIVSGAAMRGLGASMMAVFGGPVGLAIAAVAIAVGGLTMELGAATRAAQELDGAISSSNAALEQARQYGNAAQKTIKGVGTDSLSTAGNLNTMGDAARKAAGDFFTLAQARKEAAIAELDAERAKVSLAVTKAEAILPENRQADVRQNRGRILNGDIAGAFGAAWRDMWGDTIDSVDAGRRNDAARQAGQEGRAQLRRIDTERARLANLPDATFEPQNGPGLSPGAGRGGGGSGGKGKTDKAADEAARRAAASEALILETERAYRDAVRSQADTAEERHQVALENLLDDKLANDAAINKRLKEEDITAEAAKVALAYGDQAYQSRVAAENARYQEENLQRVREIERISVDYKADALSLEADQLEWLAQQTDDLEAQHKYEREALAKRQEADRERFKVEQEQLALEREKLGYTKAEIERLRQQAEANFERGQQQQTGQQTGNQTREVNAGGWGEWAKRGAMDAREFNQALQDVADSGIASLSQGLADVMTGTKDLGTVFKEFAVQMIADIAALVIKLLIMAAIVKMLEGMGVPAGAIIRLTDKASGGKGYASGTDFVTQSGMFKVGEKGEEHVYLPRGAQVVPNNIARKAYDMPANPGMGAGPITLNMTVNAQDAVLTSQVKSWIAEGSVQAVQAARELTTRDLQRRNANILGRR
jgi:tape measure domain-containing protein